MVFVSVRSGNFLAGFVDVVGCMICCFVCVICFVCV